MFHNCKKCCFSKYKTKSSKIHFLVIHGGRIRDRNGQSLTETGQKNEQNKQPCQELEVWNKRQILRSSLLG